MKIKNDKFWQEQKNSLQSTLDEDTLGVYMEVMEQVTGYAEPKLEGAELTDENVTGAIREGFGEVVKDKGYLIPDVMASLLVVLILHWEYGSFLRNGLSPIEFSLVAEAMAFHLSQKAEEAASE